MSRYKMWLLIIVGGFLFGMAGTASAFGFPSFGNKAAPDLTTATTMQTKLATDFITGEVSVLTSQADMAQALGITGQAAKLNATIAALKSGATNDNIGRAISDSGAASDEISQKMKGMTKLSASGHAIMQKAIPAYLVGVVELTSLVPDYKSFMSTAEQQVSSAPLDAITIKDKLAVGMFIGTHAPSYTESLVKSTSELMTYAKGNNISLPKDATSALGNM